jgi:hypothetical protein
MNFKEVVQNGKFYCPASLHYNKEPQQVNIVCDRCQRNGLKCSIGYENVDLCMSCADIVVEQSLIPLLVNTPQFHTLMAQSQFHPNPPQPAQPQPQPSLTRMIQHQFTSSSSSPTCKKTKMHAHMYIGKK